MEKFSETNFTECLDEKEKNIMNERHSLYYLSIDFNKMN